MFRDKSGGQDSFNLTQDPSLLNNNDYNQLQSHLTTHNNNNNNSNNNINEQSKQDQHLQQYSINNNYNKLEEEEKPFAKEGEVSQLINSRQKQQLNSNQMQAATNYSSLNTSFSLMNLDRNSSSSSLSQLAMDLSSPAGCKYSIELN